jgi:DNA-binding CsgD family transcriptional regulator
MMSQTYAQHDVAAMLKIAGEVAELPVDVHVRRGHILSGLLGLIGGCSAVCCEMDARHVADGSGWAIPGSITRAGGDELSAGQRELIERYVTGAMGPDALDPCVPRLLRFETVFATVRRGDVVDDAAWRRSGHVSEVRRPLGFGESLYAKLTTPDGRHVKLSFHRERGDRAYTSHHGRLVQLFNEHLAGLYVATATAAAVTTPSADASIESLPPRLRPVLRRLLAGDAVKQAAMTLGLSPHTVHEYTKSLYRTFGVSSRGELLSRFVSQH